MSKSSSHDVIISGGGTPGLTLALLLAQTGLRSVVIDPAPLSQFTISSPEGRTSALMQSSIAVLKQTGVWNMTLPYGAPLEILRIIDDSFGNKTQQIETNFPACNIGLDFFGINMPNNILRSALAIAARQHKVTTLCGSSRLTGFSTDDFGVTVNLDDGTSLRAPLLIAADGRESPVREKSGIACWHHDYGQSAITCLIHHSSSHQNISTEFHRPGGPFTLVPLPGNTSSVVWVEKTADADTFMALSRHNFTQALQDRTDGRLGRITLSSDPQSCPLIALRARNFTARRVALVAEAAHVLSPLGAQGLNLSLRDVDCLAKIIIKAAQTGMDIGAQSILATYEKQRRSDIWVRSISTDGLTRLVSHNHRPLHGLRRTGLKTISMIEPLKVMAMQQGMAV